MRCCIGVVAFACAIPLLGQTARVPFVGCAADRQAGPVQAPKGTSPVVRIDASTAQRLAYYKAFGFGVLAPRGWHCFGTYGSSGSDLVITPAPFNQVQGPMVEVDNTFGQGSGSIKLAQVIVAAFPARRASLQEVIKEGIDAGIEFGPYPNDKLIVKADRIVEFQTPPRSNGLETTDGLQANDDPIDGIAILQGSNPDLLMLTVRLPRELRDLAPIIIHQLERENAGSPARK